MSAPLPSDDDWFLIIRPQGRWWELQLAGVWHYRDLLWMFIRRDFVTVYKQTILGPLWFFIQPLLTTIMFTVIFTGVAKISTAGLPPMLFYLAGTTPWNYFSTCLTKTSGTFITNANLFGKVYFPRLVTPISVVASNLIQFSIQFLLFFGFLTYYLIKGAALHPDLLMILLLTPVLLLLMALLGLGAGILVSSLTTKYRDLTFLITFGVQLTMYATPVIYPMSKVPAKYLPFIEANPMSAVIETFRAIYLGGAIPWPQLGISAAVTGILLLFGIAIFNRVEKTFMDTV
ncbi:MAG: ABC transporter permease [Verrucomicrobiota bacterium]|jgi:lipopolysaccharide transport system permease protein